MTGAMAMYILLFISLYFEVFLLVSFLDRKRATRENRESRNLPRVAIIVPCFNEERTIALTIRSLLSLEYPKELLEILVVDDGSTDGTLAAARSFAHEPQLRVFHKENGGKHTAMNFALEHTDAELVGCLDADSTVAPKALLHIAPIFNTPEVAAVTPGIHVRNPENLLQHLQHVEYRLSIFNRFIFSALGSAFITPGPFSIFRASRVRELGGWRYGHSTEDLELALRMQNKGLLIANAPAATVYTSTPRTIRSLFRQRVRWTYGFLKNAADYRHMVGNRAYGNLGVLVLPAAIISIGTGVFFFFHLLYELASLAYGTFVKVQLAGFFPHPEWSLFYVNTSSMWFLVYAAVALIVALICIGSFIGTGKRTPPLATPLFLLLYGFLVPLWLSTALVRAVAGTGVRWR